MTAKMKIYQHALKRIAGAALTCAELAPKLIDKQDNVREFHELAQLANDALGDGFEVRPCGCVVVAGWKCSPHEILGEPPPTEGQEGADPKATCGEVLDAAWLDELERLAETATESPWIVGQAAEEHGVFLIGSDGCFFARSCSSPHHDGEANANLIAALRNAAPRLLPLARRGLQK